MERFPDELWSTPTPTDIPASAEVDVTHRGRYDPNGTLEGNLGGSALTLCLQLPWPSGSVIGTIAEASVSLTWAMHDGDSGISTLRGVVGSDPVDIEGVFRRRVEYQQGQPVLHEFIGASVQGVLANRDLDAAVATDEPSPVRGNSHRVAITGLLGREAFELYGDLSRSVGRGLRGTYDGKAVHLDVTTGRVFGVCPSPPPFTALVVGALMFF